MIGQAALAVGVLLGVATFLLLSRKLQRVTMAFLLLTNAVNLLVLAASGVAPGARPPVLAPSGAGQIHADPLPQAFLLTAIVIGLGAGAFLMALAARLSRSAAEPPGAEDAVP